MVLELRVAQFGSEITRMISDQIELQLVQLLLYSHAVAVHFKKGVLMMNAAFS